MELLYLYLLHSEVQEGVLVTDADQALGALTSHAGTQASIQLHHHQFVQAVGHIVRQASSGNLIIRLNLEERKEMAAGQEKKQTNKNKANKILLILILKVLTTAQPLHLLTDHL